MKPTKASEFSNTQQNVPILVTLQSLHVTRKKKKKRRNTFQTDTNFTQPFCLPPPLGNHISPSGLQEHAFPLLITIWAPRMAFYLFFCLFVLLKYLKTDIVLRRAERVWQDSGPRQSCLQNSTRVSLFFPPKSSPWPRCLLNGLGSSSISAEFYTLQDLISSTVE